MAAAQTLWAPAAWLDGGWTRDVLLAVDAQGRLASVQTGQARPADATALPGPVLPGMANAHSHAFQRAFAGMAERRSGAQDDFWRWRERMYAVALRISPAQLRAVAAQLYAELLQGGYTQVCEFHYLYHAPDGQAYADPLAMSQALAEAAEDAGIGLTLLPVLYERAGFAAATLQAEQRRFAASAEQVLQMCRGIRAWQRPGVSAGVAIHSLRAAPPESIRRLLAGLADDPGPVHIHVAEQTSEVSDCLAATGQRPVAWLAGQGWLDARWQLVHATHVDEAELDAMARSGAGVVLCPSTEANLGDGLFRLPCALQRRIPLALGSDCHVSRCWAAELRLLEYGQRLQLRQRNVAAGPETGQPATAGHLFDRHLAGGAAAAGLGRAGLAVGARADLLVLDRSAPGLRAVPASHLLDALVFATDAPALAQVWVAGRQVLDKGQHLLRDRIGDAFDAAMAELWRPILD